MRGTQVKLARPVRRPLEIGSSLLLHANGQHHRVVGTDRLQAHLRRALQVDGPEHVEAGRPEDDPPRCAGVEDGVAQRELPAAGLRESEVHRATDAQLEPVAALSVLLIFLFIRPGGILGEAK